jgi:hypothetical protein
MKQQQAQSQGTMPLQSDFSIEAVAIRNFEARNIRGDRVWSPDRIDPRRPALVLSERERLEFIEQARHQIEQSARRAKPRAGLQ